MYILPRTGKAPRENPGQYGLGYGVADMMKEDLARTYALAADSIQKDIAEKNKTWIEKWNNWSAHNWDPAYAYYPSYKSGDCIAGTPATDNLFQQIEILKQRRLVLNRLNGANIPDPEAYNPSAPIFASYWRFPIETYMSMATKWPEYGICSIAPNGIPNMNTPGDERYRLLAWAIGAPWLAIFIRVVDHVLFKKLEWWGTKSNHSGDTGNGEPTTNIANKIKEELPLLVPTKFWKHGVADDVAKKRCAAKKRTGDIWSTSSLELWETDTECHFGGWLDPIFRAADFGIGYVYGSQNWDNVRPFLAALYVKHYFEQKDFEYNPDKEANPEDSTHHDWIWTYGKWVAYEAISSELFHWGVRPGPAGGQWTIKTDKYGVQSREWFINSQIRVWPDKIINYSVWEKLPKKEMSRWDYYHPFWWMKERYFWSRIYRAPNNEWQCYMRAGIKEALMMKTEGLSWDEAKARTSAEFNTCTAEAKEYYRNKGWELTLEVVQIVAAVATGLAGLGVGGIVADIATITKTFGFTKYAQLANQLVAAAEVVVECVGSNPLDVLATKAEVFYDKVISIDSAEDIKKMLKNVKEDFENGIDFAKELESIYKQLDEGVNPNDIQVPGNLGAFIKQKREEPDFVPVPEKPVMISQPLPDKPKSSLPVWVGPATFAGISAFALLLLAARR